MLISEKIKLADVVHLDYQIVPVINRFGIQFGFGDKTIEEICNIKGINLDFFLEILNAFHDEDYKPNKNWRNFSFEYIIDYLLKSHEYYNNIQMPYIEKLIDKLLWSDISEEKNKDLLKNFFNEYRKEINTHTKYEENEIYPYIVEVENSFKKNNITSKIKKKILKHRINKYAEEHNDIDTALLDLKNIIIKYLPPPDNPDIMNKILAGIFQLEKDLKDHTNIENQVLIPKVKELETEIIKKICQE